LAAFIPADADALLKDPPWEFGRSHRPNGVPKPNKYKIGPIQNIISSGYIPGDFGQISARKLYN
jgi:hypothetical protein